MTSPVIKAEVLCLARGEIGQEQAEDEPGGPRQHENSQLAGRFRRVWQVLWQVLGSNQRRLSRRFYSPILLFESSIANLRLCVSRRNLRPSPSAMCPWAGSPGRSWGEVSTDAVREYLRLHAVPVSFGL